MTDPSAVVPAPPRSVTRGNPLRAAGDELRSWRDLSRDAEGCTACSLSSGRTSVVFGDGDPEADLMVIGDAPNRHDDLQGKPFVGGAGNVLTNALTDAGLDRESVYVTTIVKCMPPGGRLPEPGEVEACGGFLFEQIALVRPRVIVTLGAFATGLLMRGNLPLERIAGYRFDVFDGVTLIPTFHPNDALKGHSGAVPAMLRDLRTARAVLEGRIGTGAEAMAELRERAREGGVA